MDIKETKAAFQALAMRLGPEGRYAVFLSDGGPKHIYGSLVIGYGNGAERVADYADSFDELLQVMTKKLEEHLAAKGPKVIKLMALEIILQTDAKGYCSEADLRLLKGIKPHDVTDYGSAACAMADMMAGKGPFKIESGDSNWIAN